MKLTVDQVKKVAKLANLPLLDEEMGKYSDQLSQILDYIDQLDQVKTEGAEPTFNVTGSFNVLAKDIPSSSLSQDEALQNANQKRDGMFVTKGVFEEN